MDTNASTSGANRRRWAGRLLRGLWVAAATGALSAVSAVGALAGGSWT